MKVDPILLNVLSARLHRFVESDIGKQTIYHLGKKRKIPIVYVRFVEGRAYTYTLSGLGLRRIVKIGSMVESTAMTAREFLEDIAEDEQAPLENIVKSCERTATILTGTLQGFTTWNPRSRPTSRLH